MTKGKRKGGRAEKPSSNYTFENVPIGNKRAKRTVVSSEDFESPDEVERKHKQKELYSQADEFEEEASPDQLKKITLEATKAITLQKQIEDLEAAIVTLKEQRGLIIEKTLPNLMDSANMISFDLDDGSSVEIKEIVSGTLPSADKKPKERAAALAWLMKNGGKGIIKTSFVSEFGVGQEALVKTYEKLITKAGLAAKKSTGVHPQTLAAFVRELIEDGKKVPIETLGIYVGRQAKIKLSDKVLAKADGERVKPKRRKN